MNTTLISNFLLTVGERLKGILATKGIYQNTKNSQASFVICVRSMVNDQVFKFL